MRKLPTLTFLLVSAAAVAQNNGLSACLPGGAAPVTVTGDSITGPFPLGITFSFFGVNYDHCFLSDHGLIYLTDAAGLPAPPCNGGCAHTYTIDPISLTMTTPVIAPFWTDSNQYGTSTIAK